MTDDEALLRAVLAAPDDDAPRLIYADWLDEHGDPARAAFIRTQIEIARRPSSQARLVQLKQAESTLLRANRDAWTAWVPGWAEARAFHRGFLEGIRAEAGDFIARSHEVRLCTPLSAVQLDGREE